MGHEDFMGWIWEKKIFSQIDLIEATPARTRARGDDIEDSHIQVGRVALTGSHMRRMTVEQFCTPHSIRYRGSKHVVRWASDPDDVLDAEDLQKAIEDDMYMVAETEVPHHFKMEVLTTTGVTP